MVDEAGNEGFEAARAGGVIDTFLSMPDTRARQAAKYDKIRELANDSETKSMEADVYYPVQVVLGEMAKNGISKFLVGIH